jgi:hypothetical protein
VLQVGLTAFLAGCVLAVGGHVAEALAGTTREPTPPETPLSGTLTSTESAIVPIKDPAPRVAAVEPEETAIEKLIFNGGLVMIALAGIAALIGVLVTH